MRNLKNDNLINEGQHRLVPGKSTKTQLQLHHQNIYEILIQGKRMDTAFLDFAKASDKVNFKISVEKVAKQNISGKFGRWTKKFLTNRIFRVVANGTTSDDDDILSGVLQGTVLASVLFMIMRSDID